MRKVIQIIVLVVIAVSIVVYADANNILQTADSNDTANEAVSVERLVKVEDSGKSDAASVILKLANKAHKVKNYEQAFKLWRQIENDYKGTKAWGKAVYNIAIALKEQKKFDNAIIQFNKLLTSDVDDTELGAHIMEAYRNYRPKAQWEIANCYFAKGEYEKALKAYQVGQHKHSFQSWCGTCKGGLESRYALYQGLCYEHMNQYDNAIKSYFKTVYNHFHPIPPPIFAL